MDLAGQDAARLGGPARFIPLIAGLALFAAALLPQRDAALVIVTVAACSALLLILRNPDAGLALALIAGPLQPLERVELKLPIDSGQALLLLTLGVYAMRWLRTNAYALRAPLINPALPRAIPLALTGFLVVALVSYTQARDLRDWLFECLKLAQMLLLCLIVAGMNERRRAWIIGALALSAAGEALYGLLQHRICWTLDRLPAVVNALCGVAPPEFRLAGSAFWRGYGTFEQPNPFGGYMGLLWPLFAGPALLRLRAFRRARKPRDAMAAALLAGLAALIAAGLVASGSRGALAGAACAAGVMLLALTTHPRRWLALVCIAALAAYGFGLITLPASLDAQLAEYGDIDVRDTYLTPVNFSTVERLAHWQAAIRMIEASPWLGVGYGNYAAAYDEYRLLVWSNALGHAHNTYLNVPAETGVLGLIAYCVWWGAVFATTWRTARQSAARQSAARQSAARRALSVSAHAGMALGLLGAFAHLTGHHLFDNLFVANMHLTIGALLGLATGAASGIRGAAASAPVMATRAST